VDLNKRSITRIKVKLTLEQATNALSLTSALDVGGWSTPRPGRFTPGEKTRYPSYRRLIGPQGRSGRERKIWPPPEFDSRTVQPVASRYTAYALLAQLLYILLKWLTRALYKQSSWHNSRASFTISTTNFSEEQAYCLLRYDTAQSFRNLLIFRRTLEPQSLR
jgi:hypothetical protein